MMADDTSFMEGYVPPPKGGKGAQPAQTEAADDFMTGYMKPGDKPAGEPTVGVGEDIGRAVLAKGVRGAAALPGMFGDIPSLFGAEKYRPPTTEEYIQKLSSISPEVEKALAYKPVTAPGRYAGSVAEFLPSALIPGGGGLIARGLGAAGAGVGSQAVEDFYEAGKIPGQGTPYEGAAKLAGAIAGGIAAPSAAGKIGSIFRGAEPVAAERLAGSMARDVTTGTAKAPPGALVNADLAPGIAGGAETQKLLKGAAARSSDEAVGAYNAAVDKFKQEAAPRVQGVIDDIFQRPVQMFDEVDLLKKRVSDLNDVNYTRVMGMPEAQAIQNADLQKIVNRLPKGTIDDVLEQFRIQGVDPASFGLAKTKKGWAIPPQGASLRFWDEVKQQIDSNIGSYMDPITKSARPGAGSQVANLQGLKTDLVGVLDNAVDDYKKIRFEASELYGARNAMEAGYKYYGDGNFRNLNNIEKLVDKKLTPAQKQDFAYGYAAAYKDALDKNPTSALGVYGGKTGQFNADKMKFALGEENAAKLLGSVNSEYLNSTMKTLAAGGGGTGFLRGAGTGYLAGILGETALAGENLLQALSFSMSPGAIATAVLAGAGRAAYTVRERKIAEQVLKLAADPSQSERLGRLIAENQDARSFLAKFYNAAKKVPPVSAQTQAVQQQTQPTDERVGRKAGGRISAESHAADLMRRAEIAKKNIGKHTEALLNKPDETVVKALQIANQNLEG
jgi:hypothetical protein